MIHCRLKIKAGVQQCTCHNSYKERAVNLFCYKCQSDCDYRWNQPPEACLNAVDGGCACGNYHDNNDNADRNSRRYCFFLIGLHKNPPLNAHANVHRADRRDDNKASCRNRVGVSLLEFHAISFMGCCQCAIKQDNGFAMNERLPYYQSADISAVL